MEHLSRLKELINDIFELKNITTLNDDALSLINGLFENINTFFYDDAKYYEVVKEESKNILKYSDFGRIYNNVEKIYSIIVKTESNLNFEKYPYILKIQNEPIVKDKFCKFFEYLLNEIKNNDNLINSINRLNRVNDDLSENIYEDRAQGLLRETDEKLNDKLSTTIKQVDEKTNSLTTNILTVLGIFVAIIVVFISAYLSIILPEARGGLSGQSVFVHLAYYAFVGHVLFNLLFFLMFMISRLSHKNLSLACHGCPENEHGVIVCKNPKCTMRTRAWRKYPYVVFANVMFISSYGIFFLAWYAEKMIQHNGDSAITFFLASEHWWFLFVLGIIILLFITLVIVCPFIIEPDRRYRKISIGGSYCENDYKNLIKVFQQQLNDKQLIDDNKIKENEQIKIIELKNGYALFNPKKEKNRYITLPEDYRELFNFIEDYIVKYYKELYSEDKNIANKIEDIIINIRKECRP